MPVQKITKELIEKMIEMKISGEKIKDITARFDISEATYLRMLNKAPKLGIISKKRMESLKKMYLTEAGIKKICEFRKKGNSIGDISRKYGFSRPTIRIALNRGVELGQEYLTKEQDYEINERVKASTFERKVKKYGEKKARQICSDGWHKGLGSNHGALSNAGKNGGRVTQKKHGPRVAKNLLKNPIPYGANDKPYYKGMRFDSFFELYVGLLLECLKIIPSIIEGRNYHVECGRKRVDYVIKKAETKEKMSFEVHPDPVGMEEHENYSQRRLEDLAEDGWKYPLYIIKKRGEIYAALKESGVYNGSSSDFYKAVKKAKIKLGIAKLPF